MPEIIVYSAFQAIVLLDMIPKKRSFWALKFGKVSQVTPVDRLSVVFAIIFAVLFLDEKLSLIGGVGVLFITAGVIMVAMS